MDLFNTDPVVNVLPYDGIADYYGRVFVAAEASAYFERLMHGVEWRQDEVIIFGRRILTRRMVAWYGDNNYGYTYSGVRRQALEWTDDLRALKARVEDLSGARYNSCLLNLYHSGEEGVSWHSDDEKELERDGAIASVSLGVERKFQFRHKTRGQLVEIVLEPGSLLVMRAECQRFWLHALPKTKKVSRPRVNLTFRTITGA
jgi:alkylated DNA repair dioxygenase AlkB